MTNTESSLDALLSACFAGGAITCRELRLSNEQAEQIAQNYPAEVRSMGDHWYEITFQGAFHL